MQDYSEATIAVIAVEGKYLQLLTFMDPNVGLPIVTWM